MVVEDTCHSQPYMLGMLYLSQLHLHLLAIQSSILQQVMSPAVDAARIWSMGVYSLKISSIAVFYRYIIHV